MYDEVLGMLETIKFLMVILLVTLITMVKGTSLGSEFVVMIPPLDTYNSTDASLPMVLLCLLTPHESKFKVTLTTPWFENGIGLSTEIILYKLKVETISLDRKYLHTAKVGKSWTFHFKGDYEYCISVLVADSWESSASFLVLPVANWGKKYYVITLSTSFSILIFTNDGPNTISCSLHFSSYEQVLNYSSRMYHDGSNLKIQLAKNQGFIISTCGNSSSGGATGTYLFGMKPFGVITGSCDGTALKNRQALSRSPSRDNVAEMLLPVETFGSEFITLTTDVRATPGYYVVQAIYEYTGVKYFKANNNPEVFVLISIGSHSDADFGNRACLVIANHTVQIVYVQTSVSSIRPEELGDASFCLLVPTQLYYFRYLFSINNVYPATHYAFIIVKGMFINYLFLNDDYLAYNNWLAVIGSPIWHIGSVKLEIGEYVLYNMLKQTFGCYLFGLNKNTAYLRPAGYIASPINEYCDKTEMTMRPGDLLDNDCDNQIDEEIRDNEDNDGDGHFDEDLAFLSGLEEWEMCGKEDEMKQLKHVVEISQSPINGSWGEWDEWHCYDNCSNTWQFRKRLCDSPRPGNGGLVCPGLAEELKNGSCYTGNIKCPSDCSDFTWGVNCINYCHKCLVPCNKFTGACHRCSRGYKYPKQGCKKKCDPFEFGENCLESCLEKCGDDCANRETGDCHFEVDIDIEHGGKEILGWSTWSEWHCSEDCLDTAMYRERICPPQSVCPGINRDTKAGHCYIGVLCPKDCPKLQWSIDCTETCSNCQDDCDKFTGECHSCIAGYKYPEHGCKEKCGLNEFGVNCEGDCERKCGEDCVNRVTGQCRANYLVYIAMTPSLLILIPCYQFYTKEKKSSSIEESGSIYSLVHYLTTPKTSKHRRSTADGSPVDQEDYLSTTDVESKSTSRLAEVTTETNDSKDSSDESENETLTEIVGRHSRSRSIDPLRESVISLGVQESEVTPVPPLPRRKKSSTYDDKIKSAATKTKKASIMSTQSTQEDRSRMNSLIGDRHSFISALRSAQMKLRTIWSYPKTEEEIVSDSSEDKNLKEDERKVSVQAPDVGDEIESRKVSLLMPEESASRKVSMQPQKEDESGTRPSQGGRKESKVVKFEVKDGPMRSAKHKDSLDQEKDGQRSRKESRDSGPRIYIGE